MLKLKCIGIQFCIAVHIWLFSTVISSKYLTDTTVFVILSQPGPRHVQKAESSRQDILTQAKQISWPLPKIYLTHEKWPDQMAWTILPILPSLFQLHQDIEWVFFLEEGTSIDLERLGSSILNRYDTKKEIFLGKALRDRQATIVHHFAFNDNPSQFPYPDFAAGFAMSMPLIKRVSRQFSEEGREAEFSIDPQHELALYIFNGGDQRVNLTNIPEFCVFQASECVTSYDGGSIRLCGQLVPKDDLAFAVKTCQKFHKDRIPVVQNTWGKHASDITFFSDKKDPSFETVDTGVPNTERGHCLKTMTILKNILKRKDIQLKKWIILTDDDTILSVYRLQKLLSCYDPKEAVVLGERYGYGAGTENGYDYITGGGGIVLSVTAVKTIFESGLCDCPSEDYPDDMFIGICLKRLGITVTHSPHFHQARPVDYPAERLGHQIPVSFHKHWNINPQATYEEWFSGSDASEHIIIKHSEL